jgi:hypothetical protein
VARAVRTSERAGEWHADGAVSAAAWLRERCRLTHGSASNALVHARTLDAMPEVAEASSTGAISRHHVAVIARARTPERCDAVGRCDGIVADAASDEATHQRRRLHVSRSLDGMGILDGLLDPEGTEIVLTALDATMEHDRDPHDTRTTAQRRADALVDLCRVGLAHAQTGPGRRNPPQISAVADLELIEDRPGPALVEQVRADAAHGPLSTATLRRLACDARISRVITDGRSLPLDVGRVSRVVTPALWRALVVRCHRQHRQAHGGPSPDPPRPE